MSFFINALHFSLPHMHFFVSITDVHNACMQDLEGAGLWKKTEGLKEMLFKHKYWYDLKMCFCGPAEGWRPVIHLKVARLGSGNPVTPKEIQ